MKTHIKKTAITITLIFGLSSVSSAIEYDAKCLNHKGKFGDCKVITSVDEVRLEYSDKKDLELNTTIQGKKIKALSAGKYARRRVGESIAAAVLLAPIALFGLFSKKKRDLVGIEYLNSNGKPQSTLIELKPKYSPGLKGELQAMSGLEFKEKEPEEKKKK